MRIFLCLGGSILAFLLALHVATPGLINSAAAKGRIQAYLSDKAGVPVSYRHAEIRLLPLPEIIVHQPAISIPGKVEGSASSVTVRPRLLSLLRGTGGIAEVLVEAPHFRVGMSGDEKKTSLEEIEGKMRSVVRYLVSHAPGAQLVVRDGRLDLAEGSGTVYTFHRIGSRLSVTGTKVGLELNSISNLWDGMRASASVEAEGLKSAGEIRLEHLHPDPLLDRHRTTSDTRLIMSDAGLSVKFSASGLRSVNASLEGSLTGLEYSRRGGRLLMGDAVVRGEAAAGPDGVSFRIAEANIGRPALSLSGRYAWDRKTGMMTAELEGAPVRIRPLRDAALAVAGDVPAVKEVFDYLEDGEISGLRFHSRGKTVEELGRLEHLRIAGAMRGGTVYVTAKDLRFRDVAGSVLISGGVLDAAHVSASLDGHRCSGGSLRVGLTGQDAVFLLDARVTADAGRLPALLRDKQLLDDEAILRELDRLHDVNGYLQGRLHLGDRLDAIHTAISVDDMNISGRYDPLPFPLALTGGRLSLQGELLEIGDAAGSVGGSSFSGLSARLRLSETPFIDITGGRVSVTSGEIYPWLTSFEAAKSLRADIRSVSGTLSLSSIKLQGPLHEPGRWSFRAEGEARDLVLDASFLPGRAEEASGMFTVTEKGLRLDRVSSKILDSRVTVSGTVKDYRAPALDLALQGNVGPEVGAWISGAIKLPPELKLQTPFSVAEGALSMGGERGSEFAGRLLFGQGTEVSVAAGRTPDAILIPSLIVTDRGHRAEASMSITGEVIDAAFAGTLTSEALDAVFEDSVFIDAAVSGDFRVRIVHDDPRQSSAEGSLQAKNIPIPWERAGQLVLRRIALSAHQQKVVIDDAELTAGEMSFRARGKIASLPEWFEMDMDISAGGITWEAVEKALRHEGTASRAGGNGTLKGLPVRGTLRLAAESFGYRGLRWEPFEAALTYDGAALVISPTKAAFCGVSTAGELRIDDHGARLALTLSAVDLPLRPTVLCVTDGRADSTGTFQLEAGLKAEGPLNEIAGRLEGRFKLSARDGKILKSKPLDTTLDLLNESENFHGQFPDLDAATIQYSSLRARGTVQGKRLRIEEAVLESPVGIMAQGYLDLEREEMDLNVFVAPLRATRRIPVIGYFMGGNLVSIPVKLRGSIRDPQTSFLSLSAIGARTLGILESIFLLPVTVVEPIFPAARR